MAKSSIEQVEALLGVGKPEWVKQKNERGRVSYWVFASKFTGTIRRFGNEFEWTIYKKGLEIGLRHLGSTEPTLAKAKHAAMKCICHQQSGHW